MTPPLAIGVAAMVLTSACTESHDRSDAAIDDASTDAADDRSTDAALACASDGDFARGCRCDPRPSSAPPTVLVAGHVFFQGEHTPVTGASVTIRALADDSSLGSGTTDGTGRFAVSVNTAMIAQDVYLDLTGPTIAPSIARSSGPLAADDPENQYFVFRAATADSDLRSQYLAAGAEYDGSLGTLTVRATACSGAALVPTAVDTMPPVAAIRYAVVSDGGIAWVAPPLPAGAVTTGLLQFYGVTPGILRIAAVSGTENWRPAVALVRAHPSTSSLFLSP